jgi:lysophospholipase L1-like esterase
MGSEGRVRMEEDPRRAPRPAPPRELSRRRKILFALLVALFSILIVLTGAEILTRVVRRLEALPKIRLYRVNAHGSYRMKPSLEIRTRMEGKLIHMRTNAFGMAWREVTLAKAPGVKRIAFVGDSFTFGLWASDMGKTLVGVFESRMPRERYEVVNFGVPGYGLADEKLEIQEEVLRFHPDYLILVFYGGNDFLDTYLGTSEYEVVKGKLRMNEANFQAKVPPAFRPRRSSDGGRTGWAARARKALRSHFVFFRLLKSMKPHRHGHTFHVHTNITSRTFWSQTKYPDIAEKAKQTSLETLARIDDLCARHHVTLLIAAVPFREQVESKETSGPDFDIRRPQLFVEEFARERGIPYLDLLPVARKAMAKDDRPLYLSSDPHLSNEGHRIMGEALAAWFQDLVAHPITLHPAASGRGEGKGDTS